MSKKRPNIIIFNPDEMRWDSIGHMGNPAAHTPNLDRFAAKEAVSFDHAYCQNPVCVPSRCSFFTGLYPHVHGHRTMDYLLHEQDTNLFRELKDAGYYVWMNSRNDLVAGQIPGLAESHADEIYYYDKTKPANPIPAAALAKEGQKKSRYPYSHVEGVTNHEPGRDSEDVRAAIERIEHPRSEQPLCIFLGLTNPHPPYAVERTYYDRIKKERLPKRAKKEDTLEKAMMLEELRRYSGMDDYTEEQWAEMRTLYLAQCAMIDDLFGQVCEALKRSGEYDNSAIFVLSDHGDFAGDYNLPEKAQNTFEDCLTRVPLLIKPPKGEKVDPGIAKGLTELVDFYATALDYAGIEPDHDHFGISLRPMIENREAVIRRYAFCEGGRRAGETQCDEYHGVGPNGPDESNEYWAKVNAQKNPKAHEKGTMVTDGQYKYVERLSGKNELYDLRKDPLELVNIYEQEKNSGIVADMRLAILKWYQETCDVVPRTYDSRFTEEKVWSIARGFCPPECEEKLRQFARENYNVQRCIAYAVRLAIENEKSSQS